jgi:hypothetical protein
MKSLNIFLLILVVVFISSVILSCQKKQMENEQISAQEMEKIVIHGKKSAEILMKTLKKELFAAMAKDGVAGAINICKDRALQITDSLAHADPMIIDIKRTTNKYRNSKNKPDEIDAQILSKFENQFASGDKLPEFVVKKYQVDGKTYPRYYQPMKIQPLCTSCHGDQAKMKKEVVSILTEAYPEDKAHGYQSHDFRGLIRVTLAANILSGD